MSQPVTTAIVVTYKTGPHLHECLYALASDPAITHIRVVDNGNPPQARAWLENFAATRPQVSLIDPGGNVGFGTGVNRGAADAADGYLLIINPDAVLKRGSVETMIDASRGLSSPWITGGKVFDQHGRENRGPRRRELTLLRALTSFSGWNTWTLEATPPPDGPVTMEVVSGALMLTDLASFRQLGGFDERYFLHFEDVDLCRRAREAGGNTVYVPAAGALHYGATSDAPSKTVARHKGDSLSWYFRKFGSSRFERALAALVSPVMKFLIRARAKNQG